MRIHACDQRSPEWFEARKGKLTASDASTLITPTGKPSSQYTKAIARNIAEWLDLQESEPFKPSFWMSRGINMEQEALNWFAVEVAETEPVGFISSDCGLFGVSPDGVFHEGEQIIPVEIKCPMPSTLIQWHMDGGMPTEHLAQCHLAMIITDAPYMWFMAYCADLKPLLVKVERSAYTDTLEDMMAKYAELFNDTLKSITGETE